MLQGLLQMNVEKRKRPVRILQFGEGNFLRAFVDWMIDISNESGVTDMGIAICKPRAGQGSIKALKEQDNMYHVYLEGTKNKQSKKDIRLVKSIMDSFNPYEDYAKYEEYITSPDVRYIVSNTTEAGICYHEGDDLAAMPPMSFPAKMTALLYKRYNHFDGDRSKGLIIICCELIEVISPWFSVIFIGIGGAAHQSWSANIYTTVRDMFPRSAIATIIGIGTTAGGLGSMLLQKSAGELFVYAGETNLQFLGFEGKPSGYFIIFCICSVAYIIGWSIMKFLVPKYNPIIE